MKDLEKLKSQQTEKRLQELESAYLQANRKYLELVRHLNSITPKHEGQLFQGLSGLVNYKSLQTEAKAALIARDKARVALESYSIAPEASLVQHTVIKMACHGMRDGALLPILEQETSKRRIPAAVKEQPFALYSPRPIYSRLPSKPDEWLQEKWGSESPTLFSPEYFNFALVFGKDSFLALTAITGVTQPNVSRHFTKKNFPGGGLIIAAGCELPVYNLRNVQSVRLAIEDDDTEKISHLLEPVTRQIAKAKMERRWVMVHCLAGISRSASFVLAYMIRFCGMSLEEAFWCLREQRNVVRPNLGFLHQLIVFEKEHYTGTSSTRTRDVKLNGVSVAVPKFIQKLGSSFSSVLF